MKTVVPSREVCHLWAHAAQDHARNSSHSVSFNYGVLYSYGAHFPIGLRLKRKDRQGYFYLLTEDSYSVPTSKHQYYARQAVPGENHYVPRLSNGSSSETINLETVAQIVKRRARESLAEALKMRKSFKRYNKALDARRWYTSIEKAAEATGQKRKISRILGSITKDYDAAMQGYTEYERKMRAIRDRRNAEESRRGEERAERLRAARAAELTEWLPLREQTLQAWRNGGAYDNRLSWEADGTYREHRKAFLRVRDGLGPYALDKEIQTSLHASIPVDHAIKLYPLWLSLVSHKREYIRNGHTIHLGPYALDKIDSEGNITAGCHYIPADEVRYIARALGLMPSEPVTHSTASL